jgi:hypothetical protein
MMNQFPDASDGPNRKPTSTVAPHPHVSTRCALDASLA